MKKKILLAGAIALVMNYATLNAQVTIGAGTMPNATLDVVATATDGSSSEGVIAPRLTGDQMKAADSKYETAQTGAIVYATAAVSGTPAGKTIKVTAPGYYYFDGTQWQSMQSNEWFYLPSFNLDISTTGEHTVNLYDVYQNQFSKEGNTKFVSSNSALTIAPQSVYALKQLDFVVTDYDDTLISIAQDGINPNTGEMTYTVLKTDANIDSYINIVCVVK
jgi:hypothetical protein